MPARSPRQNGQFSLRDLMAGMTAFALALAVCLWLGGTGVLLSLLAAAVFAFLFPSHPFARVLRFTARGAAWAYLGAIVVFWALLQFGNVANTPPTAAAVGAGGLGGVLLFLVVQWIAWRRLRAVLHQRGTNPREN